MTVHIQVPAVTPIVRYLADGTQDVFTYPFPQKSGIQTWQHEQRLRLDSRFRGNDKMTQLSRVKL